MLLQGQHNAVCYNGGQDHVLKWSESVKEFLYKGKFTVYHTDNTNHAIKPIQKVQKEKDGKDRKPLKTKNGDILFGPKLLLLV